MTIENQLHIKLGGSYENSKAADIDNSNEEIVSMK